MTSILLIGGTRFFGRNILKSMVSAGCRVTVLTRGNRPLPLVHEQVESLVVDRKDPKALAEVLGKRDFDVAIDNICYQSDDARAILALLAGRCGRYILTSSVMTYLAGCVAGNPLSEDGWEEQTSTLGMLSQYAPGEIEYALNKRAAEQTVLSATGLETTILRLHNVAGPDDFSGKSGLLAKTLATEGRALLRGRPDDTVQLVSSEDLGPLYAAVALHSAGSLAPAYNVAAEPVTLSRYAALTARAMGLEETAVSIGETADGLAPFPLNVRLNTALLQKDFGTGRLTSCEAFLPSLTLCYAQPPGAA